MTQRPVIGVTTSRRGSRWMWFFYWLSMRLLGAKAVRLIAPLDPRTFARFDGFIIGGGDDVSAELYHGEPTLDVRIDPARDALEQDILAHADERDLPVLGVCRGAQMINVYLGGTLSQHVRNSVTNMPKLWTPLPVKRVTFAPETRLKTIFELDTLRVNSLHRHAVDKVGRGLKIAGTDEYGVTQAIEDENALFRIGVQWHPEFLIYRRSHRRLFRAFIAAVEMHMAEHQHIQPAETDALHTSLARNEGQTGAMPRQSKA